MAASIGTTALLQYVVKGYVVDMHYQPSTERVSWTVYSLFAQKRQVEAHISETAPPLWSPHPLVTFSHNNKNYYIHTDAFQDKEFLAALVKDPSSASVFQESGEEPVAATTSTTATATYDHSNNRNNRGEKRTETTKAFSFLCYFWAILLILITISTALFYC